VYTQEYQWESNVDQDTQKGFFISYNSADRRWAEWIAWQLEEEGYLTVIQLPDNTTLLLGNCRVLNVDNSGSNGELCYTFSNNGTTSTGRHLLHVDNTGKIDGEQSEQSAC
jgi:TIR domain